MIGFEYVKSLLNRNFKKNVFYEYLPDGEVLRTKPILYWYMYYKYLEKLGTMYKQDGFVKSVYYVFEKERLPFQYHNYKMVYFPDFKITYYGVNKVEYQSIENMRGQAGKILRHMLHQYPYITLRVLEEVELQSNMSKIRGTFIAPDSHYVPIKAKDYYEQQDKIH